VILETTSALPAWAGNTPEETVAEAQIVLTEALATKGAEIPAKLLADSYGVAIIPSVIKVGVVGAVRRGHGVVIVKDKDGNWTAPQFITLTGGSVGWQIGASASDVILVFNSERSVKGLMSGKFTIGADAAAAAGPVGRQVAAATDAQLKAEILSYSRTRGLFAGVSIDGSAIEIDQRAAARYYVATPGGKTAVPEEAAKLVAAVVAAADGVKTQAEPPLESTELVPHSDKLDALRGELAASASALNALLAPEWQRYLALPGGVYDPKQHITPEGLGAALGNYERVAAGREYGNLNRRAEFQKTLALLRAYRAAGTTIELPPPPR
jgi:lipid-binding SYLF domain-containing protein